MAQLANLSDSDKKAARRAGYKRKAPAKPKMTASTAVLERYIERHNDWVKGARAAILQAKKRDALRKQIRG